MVLGGWWYEAEVEDWLAVKGCEEAQQNTSVLC